MNQDIVNVFTYEADEPFNATLDAASDLIDGFIIRVMLGTVSGGLAGPLFSELLTYNEIEVYNLDEPTAFELRPINYEGDATFPASPSYVAVGYQTNKPRRDVRRGFKRLAGITEDGHTNNAVTTAQLPTWQLIGDDMASPLPTGALTGVVFSPCVIKRVKYTNSKGGISYRFPEPGELPVTYTITSYQVQPSITTQVSRKLGHGG